MRELARLMCKLGPRDRRAVAFVIARVGEVAEEEGQGEALRLVDEIIDIVRRSDLGQ
jgi:hypothetical protein